MKKLLKNYPVKIEFPIAWGDMDAFQHVNNTMYFKYFETARIAYFEKIHAMEFMNKSGIGPILASTQCKFKIPLTYPDHVVAGARVDHIEDDRFTMEYTVISKKHQKVAASGEGLIVTYDYNNNVKTPVPNEIRSRIISLEQSIKQ